MVQLLNKQHVWHSTTAEHVIILKYSMLSAVFFWFVHFFFALLLYIVNVTVTEALSNAFLWSFLWFAIRIGHLTDWRLGSSKQCFSLRFVAHCLVCQCNWTGQNFGAFTPNKAMHKIHSAYLILLDLKKNLLIQLKSFSVVWM